MPILAKWQSDWDNSTLPLNARPTVAKVLPRRDLGDDELDAIATRWGYEMLLERYERDRHGRAGIQDEAWQSFLDAHSVKLQRRAQAIATGDLAEIEEGASGIVRAEGLALEAGDPTFEALKRRLATATLDAMKVERQRLAGELDAEPSSALVVRQRDRGRDKAKPGETMLELFDLYAERRLAENGKRNDTLAQDRKVIEQFAEFVGADRSVAAIKPEHVREYRDTVWQLPPKWQDRRDMRGLTMREAAAKARACNMPRVAMTTVNKHLSTISPLFSWLIEERWDLANPCTGLFFKKVKGKNPRPPLGTERLNAILKSPLFVGFQADGKEHLPGTVQADDWRRWIPLLCLFTGMRVGETAQLRVEDVSEHETSAWVIDIRHDPSKGQTTKAGQSRAAVAHWMLVELGFVRFVERQAQRAAIDGDTRLFPDLEANSRDQIGAKPSEFWRDYLTRTGIKVARDGLGAHSFRHELADRLREEVGLVDDQIAVALGHDQKSTTAGYGSVRQGTIKFLAPVMNQVRFDGVWFDHLIATPEEVDPCPELCSEMQPDSVGATAKRASI